MPLPPYYWAGFTLVECPQRTDAGLMRFVYVVVFPLPEIQFVLYLFLYLDRGE